MCIGATSGVQEWTTLGTEVGSNKPNDSQNSYGVKFPSTIVERPRGIHFKYIQHSGLWPENAAKIISPKPKKIIKILKNC